MASLLLVLCLVVIWMLASVVLSLSVWFYLPGWVVPSLFVFIYKDELNDELITRSILGGTLALERGQLVDKEAELLRLSKEKEKLVNELNRSRNMLANERFMASAPKHKIEDEQNKLMEYQRQYDLVLLELAKLS